MKANILHVNRSHISASFLTIVLVASASLIMLSGCSLKTGLDLDINSVDNSPSKSVMDKQLTNAALLYRYDRGQWPVNEAVIKRYIRPKLRPETVELRPQKDKSLVILYRHAGEGHRIHLPASSTLPGPVRPSRNFLYERLKTNQRSISRQRQSQYDQHRIKSLKNSFEVNTAAEKINAPEVKVAETADEITSKADDIKVIQIEEVTIPSTEETAAPAPAVIKKSTATSSSNDKIKSQHTNRKHFKRSRTDRKCGKHHRACKRHEKRAKAHHAKAKKHKHAASKHKKQAAKKCARKKRCTRKR
ncbi:hypothetical protein [Poriferisphaera sp. WC338]|uniref:hypothetical protein n=1 Tax=Poriferisphaera sp. WC338 TaxID=3425129 RepID=UPI003D8179D0